MPKVKEITPNYKLSVDYYEENDNATITAHCFTPGLKGEESYVERTISMQSLEELACDTKGKVRCTYLNDSQETEELTFAVWYANNRHCDEVHDLIADLINKSEGRTMLAAFPDMLTALDNAMAKLDKVMSIVKPAKSIQPPVLDESITEETFKQALTNNLSEHLSSIVKPAKTA